MQTPNAALQARGAATATQERRLFPVACKRVLGWVPGKGAPQAPTAGTRLAALGTVTLLEGTLASGSWCSSMEARERDGVVQHPAIPGSL